VDIIKEQEERLRVAVEDTIKVRLEAMEQKLSAKLAKLKRKKDLGSSGRSDSDEDSE